MTYTPEMISKLLLTYGIKSEFIETRANNFLEKDIFLILNPKTVSNEIIGDISDALEGTSIVYFKDNAITIEKSYGIAPRSISAYLKAIKESKAEIPVFFGESLNGYEIADMRKDGNIMICGNNAKARKNILDTALSSIGLSNILLEILIPKTSVDFLKVINEKERKQSDAIIVIEDLPKFLLEQGREVEKILYIKRNAKHLHFISVNHRASAEIITNLIKKVFPIRITAHVSSDLNSRMILGTYGAEMLTGDYDYLLLKDKTVTHIFGARACQKAQ